MAETNLVIVESPAKAKTIEKYLGKGFRVRATIGHIIDLPPSKLGVDLKKGFEPQYEVIKGKKKVIDELKKEAAKADTIYLAPDPDREGEAIAWHVASIIKKMKKKPVVHRVLFNEITKNAIKDAIAHPIQINNNMFEAQQARRILDRLVGYQISPLLWDKVRRGLSAGRVQSVAVRLVCEREDDIKKFVPEEYWNFEVVCEGSVKPSFTARLHKVNGEKADLKNEAQAMALKKELEASSFILSEIQKKEQKRYPSPPFITSKLQQEGARKCGFTAKKTMMLAQKLYEGIEVEGELVGLITYMRTDSTRIAPTALDEVRAYIHQEYGKDYLPDQANFYKSKKSAQDAHEAIRPTSMAYTPDRVKDFLSKDELKLYELIWKRFVACQMTPAILDRTTFIIQAAKHELRATGSVIKFQGFITVYTEGRDDTPQKQNEEAEDSDENTLLPLLKEGESLKVHEYLPSQHFTQPPPRFTEASLVKELEEKGIGRPSTYASILSVIQDKKYVEKDTQKRFQPTSLGVLVNSLLVESFPTILDVAFTAKMEGELDSVEEGEESWQKVLQDFYSPFTDALAKAKTQMKDVKKQEIPTDIPCEKCGENMIIKFGRHGEFLACRKYPDCKSTKEFKRGENGEIIVQTQPVSDEKCEKCGSAMVFKRGRFGEFLACSAYPNCKNAKPISLGVNCPDCGKPLSARNSKRGKQFFGCTGYPKCSFATWDKPINEACPECGNAYMVEKVSKARGTEIKCPKADCGFVKG